MVGDQAPYLQPEMKVKMAVYDGLPVSMELPQKVTLEVTETEPSHQEPDRRLVLQAGDAVERRAHHGAAVRRDRHPDRGDDRRRLLRRARQGLTISLSACQRRQSLSASWRGGAKARLEHRKSGPPDLRTYLAPISGKPEIGWPAAPFEHSVLRALLRVRRIKDGELGTVAHLRPLNSLPL